MVLLVTACTKRVVTFKTDTVTTVNVTRKEIPATTFKATPNLKPVILTRIVNEIDTVTATIWKTVNDTVLVDVDCPDQVSADTIEIITNTKEIRKEKTMFGKRLDILLMFALVVGVLLLLTRLIKK